MSTSEQDCPIQRSESPKDKRRKEAIPEILKLNFCHCSVCKCFDFKKVKKNCKAFLFYSEALECEKGGLKLQPKYG